MIGFRATSFVICLALAAPIRAAEPLTVGDPAPPLSLKAFVKGEPFKEFKKGTVYVVEFSGTECAPCVKAMPILSGLKKTYPTVWVVSIYMEKPELVTEYVAKNGEKMDYAVAADDTTKTEKAWMGAAVISGIPTVFIVNSESNIAWIGHPFDMEKPLDDIVKGKHDLATERVRSQFDLAKRLEEKAVFDGMTQFNETTAKAMKLIQNKQYREAVTLIDYAVKDERDWEFDLLNTKLMALTEDPNAKDESFRFTRELFGRVAAPRFTSSPKYSHMARYCVSFARTLTHAKEGISTSNNLLAADFFLQRADVLYGYMKGDSDFEKREKSITRNWINTAQIELASVRKDWPKAVDLQKEYVELIRKEQPDSSIVDWEKRHARRLKEAEAKLAEFVKARDGGK